MHQDVEQGKQLELAALVGSVVELGQLTSTPTPTIDTVYALTRLLAREIDKTGGRLKLG
jgi:2-dehydropantoate 2-reductase